MTRVGRHRQDARRAPTPPRPARGCLSLTDRPRDTSRLGAAASRARHARKIRSRHPPSSSSPTPRNVTGKWGTTLHPETWIIDKNGILRARFDGARECSNANVVQYVGQIRTIEETFRDINDNHFGMGLSATNIT